MKNIIKEVIPYIVILIVVVIIRSFVITPVTVVGSSMYPTLKDKELLLLSKISYKIHDIERFDIVVIKEDDRIIKRIIGLPNENVSYINNVLYIDGVPIEDNYQNGTTKDFELADLCFTNENKDNKLSCTNNKIPEGYYLVLGDNREISKDSRKIGLVKKEDIIGKAVLRFWPIKNIALLK